MFDIGFSELVLTCIVGLVVLGPQRMPVAVRTLMKWVRTIRGFAANVQNELSQELKLQELQESIKKAENLNLQAISPELSQTIDELKQSAKKIKADLDTKTEEVGLAIDEQLQKVNEVNAEQAVNSVEENAVQMQLAESVEKNDQNTQTTESNLDAKLKQYIEQYHPDDDSQPSTHFDKRS